MYTIIKVKTNESMTIIQTTGLRTPKQWNRVTADQGQSEEGGTTIQHCIVQLYSYK